MGPGRIRSGIFTILLLLFISSEVDAQLFKRATVRRVEKEMNGPKRKAKQPREVRSAIKEQKKQEARQKKQYNKAVEENRERHFSMQSNDVQERMKLDARERRIRDKERRKSELRKARKSGSKKKYKRR